MKRPTPSFVCASCARILRQQTAPSIPRPYSTKPGYQNAVEPARDVPRWKETPPAMKMSLRLRPPPKQPAWIVNHKQAPVDEAYDSFLGDVGGQTPGRDLLDEETKWLALTHKSFDQGKRGFNDRLAFLGKRIVDTQTSLALLRVTARPRKTAKSPGPDPLHGLENISVAAKHSVLAPASLAALANEHGLHKVTRWIPRKTYALDASGQRSVLAQTIYSIVGAVALQQGGEVAARVARERILHPLGLD